MKKYKVTTNTEMIFRAESEDEAREMYWEDIEGTPQQTIETYFEENTDVEEVEEEIDWEELIDDIENAQEDCGNLDWISKDQAIEIIKKYRRNTK